MKTFVKLFHFISLLLSYLYLSGQETNYTSRFSWYNLSICSNSSIGEVQSLHVLRPKLKDTVTLESSLLLPDTLPYPYGDFELKEKFARKSGYYHYYIFPPYSPQISITDSFHVQLKDILPGKYPFEIVNLVNREYPFFLIKSFPENGEVSLHLYDSYGRLIYQNPRYKNDFSFENLEKGCYFYEVILYISGEKHFQKGFVQYI